jgi:hypothetical protein
MATIEELFKANQSALGVDKISFTAGQAAITPFSLDDKKDADEKVLTAEKLKVGRTGTLNNAKYSDMMLKK